MAHTVRTARIRVAATFIAIVCTAWSATAMGQPVSKSSRSVNGICDVTCTGGTMVSRDVNGDGAVSLIDLALLAGSFNKNVGESGFNAKCDFTCDGRVDLADLGFLSDVYGMVC